MIFDIQTEVSVLSTLSLYMETEFGLYSNMDKGRDRGQVKPELCLQLNTVVVETKKQV